MSKKGLRLAAAAAGERSAAVAVEDASRVRTAGQRRVNLIWEITQAVIALTVVGAALMVAAKVAFANLGLHDTTGLAMLTAALAMLSNSLFLVIGFYFGRTNHQKTGGVGEREIGR